VGIVGASAALSMRDADARRSPAMCDARAKRPRSLENDIDRHVRPADLRDLELQARRHALQLCAYTVTLL
jgi:hypothetical protein